MSSTATCRGTQRHSGASASDLPRARRTAPRRHENPRRVPPLRDYGLLESGLARPRTSAFGQDAYTDLHEKAAALLHSLARNRALVDGNKRLALAATLAFLGVNGRRLMLSNSDAYDLVIAVATGKLEDVAEIANWTLWTPVKASTRRVQG